MSHSATTGSQIRQAGPGWQRRGILGLLLGLAFIHGLLYVAIMPPWQHYDEPTHFEYVRLIAERDRPPKPGDFDLAMRREIAASMQAAGFWKDLGTPPNQFLSDEPPGIGVSELEHPPLYYALLALPQKLVMYQDVETQLYVARLTSLLLYLVVVAAAYGLLVEAFPGRRWLPAGVAAFLALLPPLTDLMSSVNNDVGAAAAVSLLLWAAVRMTRRGPSVRRVATVLLLASVCAATKSTALFVAIAILLSLGVSSIPGRVRPWVWRGTALVVAVGLVASLTWGGQAAHWLSDGEASAPNRVQVETPVGQSAFALSTDGLRHPRTIFQELGRAEGQSLRGHTVTFGAWVRAPAGEEGTFILRLNDGAAGASYRGEATADWTFQAFTTTLGLDIPGVAAYALLPNREDVASEVYLDGLVLVDGEMPVREPPRFQTALAAGFQWGTGPASNLLRNGSAERVWPGLRPPIGSKQIYRTPFAFAFYSLWDWPRTGWVYGPELGLLVETFWGAFGWNHLRLPAPYFYLLGSVTVLGFVGGGIGLLRRLRSGQTPASWQWRAAAMMAAALVVAWGATILRIHPVSVSAYMTWPAARYAVVAIVPTTSLLCLGLAEVVPKRWLEGVAWAGLLGLIALDVVALSTVLVPYYYG